jgi:catechol 2,3-dioxygenase-like lactoylglutathione lyase family enzyme
MIPRFESGRVVNQARKIKEPGEVRLRVNNMQRMKAFYRNALGFALIGELPNAALLELAATSDGHTQTIGLFKRSAQLSRKRNLVDRICFSIPSEDCTPQKRRLEELGFRVDVKAPNRICLYDPEGNQVELVCQG